MKASTDKNIEKSTYHGLLLLTMILISIFVFKTLLFSVEVHSYVDTDQKSESNELFKNNASVDSDIQSNKNTINDSLNTQNTNQKNIIKDLTLNQKIVNINRSLKDELVKLPGIGLKTADKIIEFRKTNGDFQSKEDLIKVKGIGPAKLKKIENLIKLK